MSRLAQSRVLQFSTLSIIIITLLPTVARADSSYCALYGAPTSSAASNYSSCCGLSPEAAEYLLVAGPDGHGLEPWSSARAAAIQPPYSACGAGQRCCPWSAPPTLTVWNASEPGASSAGTLTPSGMRYALHLASNYSCVGMGACCAAWECDAAFGSAARFHEWSCEMGACAERAAACSYDPLSFIRIMLLFVLPGALVLLELLAHTCERGGGRLLLVDCSMRGFNNEETLVKLGPLLLRPWAFRSLVLLNFLLPAAAHLVNATEPLDACAVTGVTRWAGYVYAIGYVLAAGIAWLWRAANATETSRFHDVWTDVLVSTHLVHAIPLGISMALGPGHSWLDHALLAHQALGLRWLVFALPVLPCMARCRPAQQGGPGCYGGVYELLDAQAWRAGVAYYDRDEAALAGGYNRRKPGWGPPPGEEGTRDKTLVLGPAVARARVADLDPQRRAVATHLAGLQEYVSHWSACGCGPWSCWGRLLVRRTQPEYRADQFVPPVLPSPTAAGAGAGGAASSGPFSIQMAVVRPDQPASPQRWQQQQQNQQQQSQQFYPRAEERPWHDAPEPELELPHSVPQSDAETEDADPTAPQQASFLNPHIRAPQFFSALDTPARAAEARAAELAKARGRKHLNPVHPAPGMPRTPSPRQMTQQPQQPQSSRGPAGGGNGGFSTPQRSRNASPRTAQRIFREALYDKPPTPRDSVEEDGQPDAAESSEDEGPVERPFDNNQLPPRAPANARNPSFLAPPSPQPPLNSTLERLRPPQLFTGASTPPLGAAPSPAIATPVIHVPAQRGPPSPSPPPEADSFPPLPPAAEASSSVGPSAPLTRSRVQDGTYVPAENLLLAAPLPVLRPQLQFEEGLAKTTAVNALDRHDQP